MANDDSTLTRDIAPFGVRMPADLKSRVASAAQANSRSMNAEIVATLEEKYPPPPKISEDVQKALWAALENYGVTMQSDMDLIVAALPQALNDLVEQRLLREVED